MRNRKGELISWRGSVGCYDVTWIDERGYYRDMKFMLYSKKEIAYKLRHEYNVVVGREWI